MQAPEPNKNKPMFKPYKPYGKSEPEVKKILFKVYPVEPDHELQVWQDWVTIRKEETSKLGKRLMRPPVDLTMNLLEKLREDKERKIDLEHAQLPIKPRLRGGPWEQPQRLKQHCYCTPVYEAHRTPAEMGRPRIIEHVGVPQYIQETEKGLTGIAGRKPCTHLNAEYEAYRQKREIDLETKIKKIDPFRPDINELLVIGSKPKPPPKPLPILPDIRIIPPASPPQDALCGVYAIRINNTVIYKDIRGQTLPHLQKMQTEKWHEHCFSWTYYFNVAKNKACRSKIFLQNLGTVTLRYCWKKIKRPIPYVPDEPNDQIFFFNKNEDVLSPGQSKELLITFVSDRPGIYNEYWEISMCNIFFFDSLATKLIINFHADASEDVDGNTKKIDDLMTDLERTSIFKIVKNLIDDAIEKATLTEPMLYPYKKLFLEAELFVMKNPVCFYHQTEVLNLREQYQEMCGKTEWDLSIPTWREAMMSKEFDERMENYEFLKNSHYNLLLPWYEGESLLEEKYRAVKLLLGQLFDKFYDEFEKVSELYGVVKDAGGGGGDYAGAGAASASAASKLFEPTLEPDPLLEYTIRNVFYLRMYEHIGIAIELCAGVISSLELNRWLEFDFCRM